MYLYRMHQVLINRPGSLLVRVFMLIVVLIVLSLVASLAIYRFLDREPHAQRTAQMVVAIVNLTRASVLAAAPEWRSALLAELSGAEGLRLLMADSSDVLQPLSGLTAERDLMIKKVRESLGESTRFAAEHNGVKALWVSFFIGNDEFWVALPNKHLERAAPQEILLGGSLVLGLALLGAYLVARQVAHPLKQLAQAAHQVGRGAVPQFLPERGAQEIVAVSRAFNQMSADLASHERERALVLAGISHDLRTPLARVRLAAEMTANESLREGIAADVDQMDAVIKQFLDYARLDENEAAIKTDIQSLIREVAQRFEQQAKSLRFDLSDVPALTARPLLLQRALSNLLDNALKYGGGEITLQLRQDGNQVALSVMDSGAGIPAAQREVVKRPFIRLDAARSNTTGSGIGLAIVERAARLHGGEFILADNPQGGLVATLMLPCT